MSKVKSIQDIVNIIAKVAKKQNKTPQQVSYSDLAAVGVGERAIRKYGRLPLIKAKYYPETEKDLVVIDELKKGKKYIQDLENQVADIKSRDEMMRSILQKVIIPVKVAKPVVSRKKVKLRRHVVAMLNDTHYGLQIEPTEVGNTNEYNWKIACRRTAMFAKQVADYKIEKRHEVEELHLVLNGDHLQGIIHDQKSKTQDLLGIQQNGTMHVLTHFIGYVSQFYKKTTVYCNAGNHDDNVNRREGGRITSHKTKDSFLTPVFFGLSLAFRNNSNIQFVVSNGLHVDLHLPAGRAAASHGDTLFTKQLANPGSSLNVRSLSDVINRWNSGEIDKGKQKVRLWLFGHTHTHSELTTFDGVRVVIAPSLSGIDNYAHSLSINHNQVGQMLFESTERHIYGDSRLVNLIDADKDGSLDRIIPTYNGKLSI